MNIEVFKLYDKIKIRSTGETGVIVSVSSDCNSNPAQYFVEKDDSYKVGDFLKDCVWCSYDEIERI